MTESLFSPAWYRVADVVPRLRSHARIHRQRYRGRRWYLLQDRSTGRFHGFSPAAHWVIGLMDGRRSVGEIWRLAGDRLGDDLPSQDEMIRLLAQLYHSNALVTDASPDVVELVLRGERARTRQRWQKLRSPFAIRIPLVDPNALLDASLRWVRGAFSSAAAGLWLLVIGAAGVLAGQHWDALSSDVTDRVLAAENLFLLWLAFPVVKVLHELGHAFAVKRWGGEVHEMGILLLVGVPVPYVDATASTAFASRWQRVLVGAAGVGVELFVAALATFVWVAAEPGTVRSIAFNVMLIASVSSLVFNGNPFLRFDAYYVLSDWLEMPNLGQRANQYWGYWFRRYAFGSDEVESPAHDGREAAWLALYAVLAFATRLAVTLSIALFVASQLFAVGVLLAAWSIFQFALLPALKQVRFLTSDPRLSGQRSRALFVSILALGAPLLVALLLPLPSWTRAEGVVWARQEARVLAETEGRVVRLLADPGSVVAAGQALFELDDPDLAYEVRAARASLGALEATYADERTRDRVQAEITRERLAHARARLARTRERLAALTVLSPAPGRFLVDRPADWPGRYVARGALLAFVEGDVPTVVRVAVPAEAIDLVRQRTTGVEVRFAERLAVVEPAQVSAELPAATDALPSGALLVGGGGRIAARPREAGDPGDSPASGGARAYRRHFLLDLEVAPSARTGRFGGRAYVRFAHAPEPLALQGYRAVRRLFLSRFGV